MCGGCLGVFVGFCVALSVLREWGSCQHHVNILAWPVKNT